MIDYRYTLHVHCRVVSILITSIEFAYSDIPQADSPEYQGEDCRLHRARHRSYLQDDAQHSASIQEQSLHGGRRHREAGKR